MFAERSSICLKWSIWLIDGWQKARKYFDLLQISSTPMLAHGVSLSSQCFQLRRNRGREGGGIQSQACKLQARLWIAPPPLSVILLFASPLPHSGSRPQGFPDRLPPLLCHHPPKCCRSNQLCYFHMREKKHTRSLCLTLAHDPTAPLTDYHHPMFCRVTNHQHLGLEMLHGDDKCKDKDKDRDKYKEKRHKKFQEEWQITTTQCSVVSPPTSTWHQMIKAYEDNDNENENNDKEDNDMEDNTNENNDNKDWASNAPGRFDCIFSYERKHIQVWRYPDVRISNSHFGDTGGRGLWGS